MAYCARCKRVRRRNRCAAAGQESVGETETNEHTPQGQVTGSRGPSDTVANPPKGPEQKRAKAQTGGKDASGQSAVLLGKSASVVLLGNSAAQLVRCDHGGDRRRETRASTGEIRTSTRIPPTSCPHRDTSAQRKVRLRRRGRWRRRARVEIQASTLVKRSSTRGEVVRDEEPDVEAQSQREWNEQKREGSSRRMEV